VSPLPGSGTSHVEDGAGPVVSGLGREAACTPASPVSAPARAQFCCVRRKRSVEQGKRGPGCQVSRARRRAGLDCLCRACRRRRWCGVVSLTRCGCGVGPSGPEARAPLGGWCRAGGQVGRVFKFRDDLACMRSLVATPCFFFPRSMRSGNLNLLSRFESNPSFFYHI